MSDRARGGVVFTSDSIRDYIEGVRLLHVELPREGPDVAALGFRLGLLWYHLVALLLSVDDGIAPLSGGVRLAALVGVVGLICAVRRLFGWPGAACAGVFALHSTALGDDWFTHVAFVVPAQAIAVHELVRVRVGGETNRIVWAFLWLSVAAQLHASALPLFLLPAATLVVSRADASPRRVGAAAVAFLAPFLPFYGDVDFQARLRDAGFGVALLDSAARQTLLLPALVGVACMARPSLLRAREAIRYGTSAALAWAVWLWVASERTGHLELRLFNFVLHAPNVDPAGHARAPLDQLALVASVLQRPAERVSPGPTELLGCAIVLGAYAILSRVGGSNLAHPVRAARFVLAWAALTVPCGLAFFAFGNYPQPYYLAPMMLATCAVAGAGVSWVAGRVKMVLTAEPLRGLPVALRVILASALGLLSCPGGPVALSVLGASPAWAGPTLVGWAVAASSLLVVELHGPLPGSLATDRVAARVMGYALGPLGLGDDVLLRVHGADRACALGELYDSPWLLLERRRPHAPTARHPSGEPHYRLVPERDARSSDVSIPGTVYFLREYVSALRGAEAAVTLAGGQGARPLMLPYRPRPAAARGLPGFWPGSPTPGDVAESDELRVVIPRDAPADESLEAAHVLFRFDPSTGPCKVAASFDGRPIAQLGSAGAPIRHVLFDLRGIRRAGELSVSIDGCVVRHFDVFDDILDPTTRDASLAPDEA